MWFPLFVIFMVFATVNGRIAPVVKTNYGSVRGKWLTSPRNISIASYLGIPYAEPPIGELRFESPKPWEKVWTDVRDASEDGSMCVQLGRDGVFRGTEDCLNLNIFVPLILPKRNLPVIVFVHGGGFNRGSNNSTYFAPDYLIEQEVVLVTVNYRLNIFGFLSTATEKVPGNAGLKDIREALKWVQNNIIDFGGDPNITCLVGQSSGAGAVHHLALSQSTEGLFDKYVTHSGSALAPWAIHPPFLMRMKYLLVAKEFGCTTNYDGVDFQHYMVQGYEQGEDEVAYTQALEEDEEILSCLKELSPSRLANAENLLHVWKMNPWCNFGPTVEVQGEDAIITKHPLRTIQQREFRDIPWITGVVDDEGLLKTIEAFLNRDAMEDLIARFEELGSYYLESEEVVANTTIFVQALTEFYFPDGIKNTPSELVDDNFTQMTGDGLITWHSYRALNLQAQMMNASAYFYLFSYQGTFSVTYVDGIPFRYGVAHFDDMNYLFPSLNNRYADFQLHNTGSDWTMINIMTELWTNFARNGVPTARQTPDWEPYQTNNSFMRIGYRKSPVIEMEQNFLEERMEFWDELMAFVSHPLGKLFSEDEEECPGELAEDGQTSEATKIEIFSIQNLLAIFFFFILVVF